jgi:cytoskeletal protein CcmA (bactofilin family)
MTRQKGSRWLGVLVALLIVAAGIVGCQRPAVQEAWSYVTKVYLSEGGDKLTVASTGEIELQSGSTFDAQSGATVGIDALTVATVTATGQVQGEHLKSTDDIEAADAITSVSMTASGTVQGEQLTSTDDITATDSIGCASLTASGTVTGNALATTGVAIGSGAGTFTATVSAEQVTSTDDIEATDNISGASLTLDSLQLTGPMVYGVASNVIDGTTIAHGVGTTPTMALLTPFYASNLTQTVSISAMTATSITVEIEAGSVTTVTTVYWLAGK